MNVKNISIWLIILLISIALIITSFSTNPYKNKEENSLIISKKSFNNSDFDNIIEKVKIKNNYLNTITDVNDLLKKLIIKNINTNIKLQKSNLKITKQELLENIIRANEFRENNKFSKQLYENFLKESNLSEFKLQKIILDEIKKKKIRIALKIIKNNYEKNLNTNYINFKKNFYKNFKKNIIFNENLNNLKKITFIDLSAHNYIKNFKHIIKKETFERKEKILSVLKFYYIENNNIKKKYIMLEKKIQYQLNDDLIFKNYILTKNFVISKNINCYETFFLKKKEIINSYYKKESINIINSLKNYINKNLHNTLLTEILKKLKKNIMLNKFDENFYYFNNINNNVTKKDSFLKIDEESIKKYENSSRKYLSRINRNKEFLILVIKNLHKNKNLKLLPFNKKYCYFKTANENKHLLLFFLKNDNFVIKSLNH